MRSMLAVSLVALLLAACGGDAPPGTMRAPDGPWILDAQALADSVEASAAGDPRARIEAASKARRSRLELELEAGGAWKGRAVDPDGEEDRLRGRWSLEEGHFALRVTERNGKPADEPALVGTYDGKTLRLAASEAPGTPKLLFRRP